MPSSTAKKNNTKKQPQDRKYGSGWKSPLQDLTLPSGELAQVKRPGLQKLVEANVLDSMDTLTGIVSGETIPKAEGKRKVDVKAVMADTDAFGKMMAVVDKITLFCVVQPKLVSDHVTEAQSLDPSSPFHKEPIDPETGLGRFIEYDERDEDAVYIDYVDDMDKMFIMNFVVGGSADLERFRQETTEAVGSASAGEDAPGSPE